MIKYIALTKDNSLNPVTQSLKEALGVRPIDEQHDTIQAAKDYYLDIKDEIQTTGCVIVRIEVEKALEL